MVISVSRYRWLRMTTLALAVCSLTGGSAAQAQNNTQRGATFGGITGAIAGAIIGDNNNEAGAGAAIGGAIGAVAGGLIGNAEDKDAALRRGYYTQPRQVYTQTIPAPVPTAVAVPTGAVGFNDVIAMSRSGVGQSVILNQIYTRGVQVRPGVSDIISLHQQGVSEPVIAAMQQAQLGSPGTVYTTPSTTIVEAPVIVQPRAPRYGVPTYHSPHQHGHVYRARPSYRIHYGH